MNTSQSTKESPASQRSTRIRIIAYVGTALAASVIGLSPLVAVGVANAQPAPVPSDSPNNTSCWDVTGGWECINWDTGETTYWY